MPYLRGHGQRRSPAQQLAKRTAPGPNGCRYWLGKVERNGYGRMNYNMSSILAHRAAWEVANGRPIPDGMLVQHTCDKYYPPGDITYRRCVEPTHLELGTKQTNILDCLHKGRLPHAKVTPEQVSEIRALYQTGNYSFSTLAARIGASPRSVRDIILQRTWIE
jgi:hypothetical protein